MQFFVSHYKCLEGNGDVLFNAHFLAYNVLAQSKPSINRKQNISFGSCVSEHVKPLGAKGMEGKCVTGENHKRFIISNVIVQEPCILTKIFPFYRCENQGTEVN